MPATLVAIVGLTIATVVFALAVPAVGDEGELPDSLPSLSFPDGPLSLETLSIIGPFALAMALVGRMESLMTAKPVDDVTDTHSNKTREAWGQGSANVVPGPSAAWVAARFTEVVDVAHPDEDTRVHAVVGERFFASSNDLIYQFDYVGDPKNVVIDLSRSHIWDASTVATLDAITTKYAAKGKNVTIAGLNDASQERHERLAGHLGAGH